MTRFVTAAGDLFTIAARELGDATQWFRIAEANGLTETEVPSLTRLAIPDPLQPPTEGLPDQ